MNFPTRVLCAIIAIVVSGCANLNSIHRDNKLPIKKSKVVFTDAKQRAIISNRALTHLEKDPSTYKDDKYPRQLRICSEAAPDVFSAYATSAAAEIEAKVAEKSGSGAFSLSSSENAAAIPRTQTVNLLREAMYRTCERYLNGAIDKDELIVQAARDQQMIVSMLAIEQLTGVYTPTSTALTTRGNAATGGPTEEIIKLVDSAKKAADTAATNAENAAKEAKGAKEAAKDIPENHKKKDCHEVVGDTSLPEADRTKCQTAIDKEKEADELAKKAKTEKEHYEQIKKMAGTMGGTFAATSGDAQITPGTNRACCNSMSNVARTVERIVANTFRFNEVQMACVVMLRKGARGLPVDPDTKGFCFEILIKSIEIEENFAKAEIAEAFAISQKTLSQRERLMFDVLVCADAEGASGFQAQISKIADEANTINAGVFGRSGLAAIKSLQSMAELSSYLETKDLAFMETLSAGAARACNAGG